MGGVDTQPSLPLSLTRLPSPTHIALSLTLSFIYHSQDPFVGSFARCRSSVNWPLSGPHDHPLRRPPLLLLLHSQRRHDYPHHSFLPFEHLAEERYRKNEISETWVGDRHLSRYFDSQSQVRPIDKPYSPHMVVSHIISYPYTRYNLRSLLYHKSHKLVHNLLSTSMPYYLTMYPKLQHCTFCFLTITHHHSSSPSLTIISHHHLSPSPF